MQPFYAKLVFVAASILYATLVSNADDSPNAFPSVKESFRPLVPFPKTKAGVRTLKGFRLQSDVIAFSSQGKVTACVTRDGNIWVWDLMADKAVQFINVPVPSPQEQRDALASSILVPNPNRIAALAFSPDGKTLAAGSSKIRLWNLETGKLRHTIELTGKEGERRVSALAFSPDGKALAMGSHAGTLRLWDARTWQWKAKLQEKENSWIGAIAFSANSLRLVCGGSNISLWDVAKKVKVRSFEGAFYDMYHPQSLAISPDGKTLVTGGDRTPYTENWSIFDYGGFFGVVHIWDVMTGALRKTITFKDERVHSLAYAPDGLTLAAAYIDVVRLWNTHNWHLQQSLGSTSAKAISYVEGSKTLALVSDSAEAKLWSPSFLNEIHLGVLIQTANLEGKSIATLGLKQSSGVQIVSVVPGGIAAQCGLRKDDIILRIDGRTVDSTETVSESIQALGAGETIVLSVLRQGRLLTVRVQSANQN